MDAYQKGGAGLDGETMERNIHGVQQEARQGLSRKQSGKVEQLNGESIQDDEEIIKPNENISAATEKVRNRNESRLYCSSGGRKKTSAIMEELGFDPNNISKTALISKLEDMQAYQDEMDGLWMDMIATYDNVKILCEKRGKQLRRFASMIKDLADERDEWKEIAERYIEDEGSESSSDAEEMVKNLT